MKLRVSSRANRDLANIAHYLLARNPQAAAKVGAAIRETFDLLLEWPLIGRESEKEGFREFPVPRMPYLVIYRVTADTVDIASIFHTSRNPADK